MIPTKHTGVIPTREPFSADHFPRTAAPIFSEASYDVDDETKATDTTLQVADGASCVELEPTWQKCANIDTDPSHQYRDKANVHKDSQWPMASMFVVPRHCT